RRLGRRPPRLLDHGPDLPLGLGRRRLRRAL
ncbi:hypothetical protein BN1708_020328, partial [Verticillium longisporum]